MRKKYDQSFLLFLAIIAGITGIIVLINVYSPVSVKELKEKTGANIEMIEESLNGIQEKFDQYGRIMDRFAEKNNDWNLLEQEIKAIEKELLLENVLILGTYYKIMLDQSGNTLEKYIDRSGIMEMPLSQIVHLPEDTDIAAELEKEGVWKKGFYQNTGYECFLYVRPILLKEQVMSIDTKASKIMSNDTAVPRLIGYAGLILQTDRVLEQIEKEQGNTEWDCFIFMDDLEAEKTIGVTDWARIKEPLKNSPGSIGTATENRKKVYTFKMLDTGMIYVEVYKKVEQIQYSNMMILIVGVFAIAAMYMILVKDRTGRTVFDRASDYIMKNYINKIDTTRRQGTRATIALNIGMAAAIFADVVYSITLGRGIKTLSEYLLFLTLSSGILLLYKHSKIGITKKMAGGIIIAGLTGPLAEHIMSGGFVMGRTGDSFLWFIVCFYIALFILGAAKALKVLYAVVVLLFLDVVLEIVLFQDTNYEGSYLFAVGFILLAFALYNAMEIYVSGAVGHYSQTKKLIKEINKNQNLLLQKEKLGALGQLISGVAHEINTPIGAIKASAETMDGLFISTLEEILSTAGTCSDKEYEAFLKLVSMTLKAKSEMKSTLEVRIAKKEVKKYLDEMNIEKSDRILTFLGELEIVNLGHIKENLELFQMEHITDILEKVAKLTAFTSGIPIILYASDRVAQIVLALKSYVHTSSVGGETEFNLTKSIENVLTLFRNQLKSNINVNRIYGNSPCIITGNPDELAQVWTNLIQNAIHAMNGDGELTIEINEQDDETVEISIGDNGAGIAPELLDQIYEPFFTTKMNGEGSGLGLNITKKIIEKHHGKLEVESQIGKGTIFHIHLNKTSEL